ncbi:hypothetical protein BGW38_008866 [Lunasporangiospora selenospora]|uniref:Uncharacterized protein n=1 Tax=Lunasporangiospora selenospora TaxID=979761 RepID=A0A9P6FYD5_9FUNG|nr:hypothetical protein BGW38_008866 [Lunasporangiospora selenospora]
MRVSRIWNQAFAPYFWRNIDVSSQKTLGRIKTSEALSSMITYKRYIRHLRVRFLSQLQALDPPAFRPESGLFDNLRCFEWSQPNVLLLPTKEHLTGALTLIDLHPRLEEVSLTINHFSPDHTELFCRVFRNHRGLKRLRVKYFAGSGLHVANKLILAAASMKQLEQLHFVYEYEDLCWGGYDSSDYVRRNDLVIEPTSIRDISIVLEDGDISERDIVFQLLVRCPLLERLSIPMYYDRGEFTDLQDILGIHCPLVRHLALGELVGFEDEDVAEVIESCAAGLCSFKTHEGLEMDHMTVRALAQNHGRTLETLDLAENSRWPSHLFLDLVQELPNLQVLKASLDFTIFHQGEKVDYDETRFGRDWPCRGQLKTLYLALFRGSDAEEEERYRPGGDSATDRYINYMYSQVGAMVQLQELSLGGWMMLLRSEWGLYRLAGLERMRVLDLRDHTFVRLTNEDVLWMAEHWRGLAQVWGLRSARETVRLWQSRRPSIEFV